MRCEVTSGGRARGEQGSTQRSAGEPGPDGTLWVVRYDLRLRAKRTENIWVKSLTLDVSRLSGWLKDFAPCAEAKGRAHQHAERGVLGARKSYCGRGCGGGASCVQGDGKSAGRRGHAL